jgi:tetratricopeptide repeat protein 21B
LYYSIANSFAKLANKNSKIVNVCVQMVQKAIQIDGTKGEYHSALGFMYGLLGDLNQSKSAYDNACKLDPQSVFAMEGLIEYSIQSENFQSASDQLELFNEIQGSAISERICYLNAVLYQKQNQMSDKALIHLREALKVAFAKMKRIPFSFEAYSILNPGLLLDITEEYLKIVQSLDDKNMSYHTIAEELLSMICKMVPGSTEARFLVAKAKILLNDPIAAEKQLLQCISKSKSNYKAQLLMAEIYIQKKNYSGALSALDMALSFDFQIRHRIDFVLLKAKCLNGLESYSDAIILLKSALQLPQCKEAIKGTID